MTTNAVNYKLGADQNAIKKFEAGIKQFEAELKKAGVEIDRDKLIEAIRSNKANELLRANELEEEKWHNKMDILVKAGSALLGKGGISALLGNDESWHNKLTETYDQATNLTFSYKGGQPIPAGWTETDIKNSVRPTINDFSAARIRTNVQNGGIALIKYVPTFSIQAQNVESGETQNVVRTIWNRVRSSNSGYINGYDQSDLFQFFFASSAVAEVLATIMRPFNYMDSKRKQGNIYMSSDKHVLNAMTGGRANSVIANKTAFIQVINSKLRSVNAQKLPIGFDLTKRRLVLNKNIFTHKNNKDEMYIFLPMLTYIYDEANSKCTATAIDYNVIFSNPDQLADFLEKLISPLVNGNASSIMAGDIAKAYPKKVGTLNALKYTLKGELYSEDEHILEAIRNANVVGCINRSDYDQFDIKQGINVSQDTFVYTGTLDTINNVMYFAFNDSDWLDASEDYPTALADVLQIDSDTPRRDFYHTNILDVKSDTPTKYDVMALTRFKVNRKVIIEGKQMEGDEALVTSTIISGCGTEIINDIEFIVFENSPSYANNSVGYKDYTNIYKPQWLDCYSSYGSTDNSYVLNFRYFPYVPYRTLITDIDSSNYDAFAGYTYGRGNYNMRIITQWELDQLNIASFGSLLLTEDDKINDSDLA